MSSIWYHIRIEIIRSSHREAMMCIVNTHTYKKVECTIAYDGIRERRAVCSGKVYVAFTAKVQQIFS